jgi:hypothetical protein
VRRRLTQLKAGGTASLAAATANAGADPGDELVSVFCVDVDGNQAIIGSIVEESNTSFVPVGSQVFRKVIDNGQGASDPPDQTGTISFFPPVFTQCFFATFPIATGPVVQGNFVVKDGG